VAVELVGNKIGVEGGVVADDAAVYKLGSDVELVFNLLRVEVQGSWRRATNSISQRNCVATRANLLKSLAEEARSLAIELVGVDEQFVLNNVIEGRVAEVVRECFVKAWAIVQG